MQLRQDLRRVNLETASPARPAAHGAVNVQDQGAVSTSGGGGDIGPVCHCDGNPFGSFHSHPQPSDVGRVADKTKQRM